MIRALLLLVIALATTAHADVWQRAIDSTDATNDRYDAALRRGDEFAQRADAKAQTREETTRLVDMAILAYQEAAAIRTGQAEPYFRIAMVLEAFFTDCESRGIGMPAPATCPNARAAFPNRVREALDPRCG